MDARPALAPTSASEPPTVSAPLRTSARPAGRRPVLQRGSTLAQLAILLASIGVIALAVLQVLRS